DVYKRQTQIDPDGATLEGDAVEFVQGTNPDVGMPFAPGETSTETALYEHRGWGVTRHATDTIPKVGAQAAAANNAAQTFIKLTGGKLLAGSTRITGVEGTPAIGYYPFYITWTTGLASGTTTVDGVQVRQAFAAPGVGPVYRVDNPTAVGVRFGRRPDGTTVLAAQLDADTGGAAFRPNHNSPYNYVLNNDLGNPSFGGGETADASPNPRFARGPNILDYNLVYRTTTGTSTIGWSGTPDSPADQDDHILRYYVDVVQPVQYANNGDWALQYSTFVLTRSQLRASGTDLVNRLGGAGSSNYFDAHIFSRLKTTNFVPILNTDADGNRASSGWAIYKARLAAWGCLLYTS
ncbi:MAG: hypothetical protein MPK62_14150, partial [Alphaproteobacteria bacterium]|nr:hypothetical protein [Alphaproteobacteria bacterium]